MENELETFIGRDFIDKWQIDLDLAEKSRNVHESQRRERAMTEDDSEFSEYEHDHYLKRKINLKSNFVNNKRIRINLIDKKAVDKREKISSSTERTFEDDTCSEISSIHKAESVGSLDHLFTFSNETVPYTKLYESDESTSPQLVSNMDFNLNSNLDSRLDTFEDKDSNTFDLKTNSSVNQQTYTDVQKVKSIKQFNEELKDRLDELNLNYKFDDVIINEIIVRNDSSSETKFLCYLNEI